MIVTDYNEMTYEEIISIFENVGTTFLIEDGKITESN